MRGVGLISEDPEFKSRSAVELIPGGVNSACHPSEVGKMSASLLVSCVGVATRPRLCQIAKETAQAAPTLCTEYGPDGWMESGTLKNRIMNINCDKIYDRQDRSNKAFEIHFVR